jgi:hypothetical protein
LLPLRWPGRDDHFVRADLDDCARGLPQVEQPVGRTIRATVRCDHHEVGPIPEEREFSAASLPLPLNHERRPAFGAGARASASRKGRRRPGLSPPPRRRYELHLSPPSRTGGSSCTYFSRARAQSPAWHASACDNERGGAPRAYARGRATGRRSRSRRLPGVVRVIRRAGRTAKSRSRSAGRRSA